MIRMIELYQKEAFQKDQMMFKLLLRKPTHAESAHLEHIRFLHLVHSRARDQGVIEENEQKLIKVQVMTVIRFQDQENGPKKML